MSDYTHKPSTAARRVLVGDMARLPKPPDFGSFQEDTAAKTGRSEQSIKQDATRAKHIPQIEEVIGTSLDKGEELDALAKLAPEAQAPIIARAKAGEKVTAKPAAKKARRAVREKELAEATQQASEELGSKLYNVIYADPPWRFEPYSRETGMDRAADNHYPTMTTEHLQPRDPRRRGRRTVPMGYHAHAQRSALRSWKPGALATNPATSGSKTKSARDTGAETGMSSC